MPDSYRCDSCGGYGAIYEVATPTEDVAYMCRKCFVFEEN